LNNSGIFLSVEKSINTIYFVLFCLFCLFCLFVYFVICYYFNMVFHMSLYIAFIGVDPMLVKTKEKPHLSTTTDLFLPTLHKKTKETLFVD